LTPPPPLPSWFGPRASTDDPAVAALLDQVAPARTWQDIGGSFNLNVRLDAAAPLVLRVHRPWATRGRVAGLRRLRERLQRAGIRVAQPVPILGRDLARLLPGQITLIPLHWVATAGFMDEPTGVHGTVGVSEAETAMDAAEAWWARREELTW
jgi:hypothetical protein